MDKGAVMGVAPLEDAADAHAKEIVYNNNKNQYHLYHKQNGNEQGSSRGNCPA